MVNWSSARFAARARATLPLKRMPSSAISYPRTEASAVAQRSYLQGNATISSVRYGTVRYPCNCATPVMTFKGRGRPSARSFQRKSPMDGKEKILQARIQHNCIPMNVALPNHNTSDVVERALAAVDDVHEPKHHTARNTVRGSR